MTHEYCRKCKSFNTDVPPDYKKLGCDAICEKTKIPLFKDNPIKSCTGFEKK